MISRWLVLNLATEQALVHVFASQEHKVYQDGARHRTWKCTHITVYTRRRR